MSALHRFAARPSWWLALGLLVVNDHLLKYATPSALTGKLSDFAGLYVAAPLLAALLAALVARDGVARDGVARDGVARDGVARDGVARDGVARDGVARDGVARIAAYVATGAVFSAINLSRGAADLVEACLPWRIWTDPSDLVALPMLVIAWRRFEGARWVPSAKARLGWRERFAVGLGGLACLATSPPIPLDVRPPSAAEVQLVGLYAESWDDESSLRENVRVRRLLPGVTLDCERLRRDPRRAVTRRLFAPAERWSLGHREEIALQAERECDVVWLEHDAAGVVLVAWTRGDAVRVVLERNGDAIGWVEDLGGGYLWRGLPRAPIPGRACEALQVPPTLSGPWPTHSPTGLYTLVATASPDGCTELTLTALRERPLDAADPLAPPVEPSEADPSEADPSEPVEPMTPIGPEPGEETEPPAVTRLFACGYPAELFAVFDGPVQIDVAGSPTFALTQRTTDGAVVASLSVTDDTTAVFTELSPRAVDGCEAANACGEIATPWVMSPAEGSTWVELGPGSFSDAEGISRVDVLLAQAAVAVDAACVDGVGRLGPRFVVARSDRYRTVSPPSEEPTEESPMDELPTEESPMDELPTEEPPMDELPTEEPPAEESPSEEPA